jgi:RNA polymerase sigma factor (sigma-70 family)
MKRQVLPLVPKRGREGAPVDLATTYRAVLPVLMRYASRMVSARDADDVVQDAMLKFLAQRREGAGDGDDAAEWAPTERDLRLRLVSMLRDSALDRLRREKAELRLMQLISGPTATMRRWMNPRRSVEDAELRMSIEQAVARLSPYVREPWLLSREMGMTVDEIATLLGITPASCRTSITRANAELRRMLEAYHVTPRIIGGGDPE